MTFVVRNVKRYRYRARDTWVRQEIFTREKSVCGKHPDRYTGTIVSNSDRIIKGMHLRRTFIAARYRTLPDVDSKATETLTVNARETFPFVAISTFSYAIAG